MKDVEPILCAAAREKRSLSGRDLAEAKAIDHPRHRVLLAVMAMGTVLDHSIEETNGKEMMRNSGEKLMSGVFSGEFHHTRTRRAFPDSAQWGGVDHPGPEDHLCCPAPSF
jgi:hypothetical protein